MTTPSSSPAKNNHNPTQQAGPDTGIHEHRTASKPFRTVDLLQARSILAEEVPHLICLPLNHLWKSYPTCNIRLTKVRQYLVQENLLTEEGKWNCSIRKEDFAKRSRSNGNREVNIFRIFSRIFDKILSSLADSDNPTSACVNKMVHAGSIEPRSDRTSPHRPDAFLVAHTQTSPIPTGGRYRWRDLTCPFEYKFGDGGVIDNDTKVLWSLHHIMRSDPRRIFSFGVTVCGTAFSIWLLCRAAPFIFTPFNWFENPDHLIEFFTILATSSATDLGFDTEIKRVGDRDFDLQFSIQGTEYKVLKLLYDIGADAPCGRGTWVFEVEDKKTKEVRVLKDCWVEDRKGRQMEHKIVEEIKKDINAEDFLKYFVDICGHHKTDVSGGFQEVCDILTERTFEAWDDFRPQPLVPARPKSKPTYTNSSGNPNQGHHSRRSPPPTRPAPDVPPYSRFRYQVVYSEKGVSLFEVASLEDVFKHLDQTVDALLSLHEAGWIHRDLSPGNIIAVGGVAKISDLEFAKRRVAQDLERLTRPTVPSLPAMKDTRTGTLLFTAIEVKSGTYGFLPTQSSPDPPGLEPLDRDPEGGEDGSGVDPVERLFLHNPLHDYESVWWIAVWFVFHCKPEGETDDAMSKTRVELYNNRCNTFIGGSFDTIYRGLPEQLRPLGRALVWVRKKLIEAYRSFETTFDGSKMLSIAQDLKKGLESLGVGARNVNAALPKTSPKRTRDETDQVEANEVPETGEEPLVGDAVEVLPVGNTMEEPPVGIVMGSGGGQSSQGDDLFWGSGGPAAEPGAEKPKALTLKRRLSPSSASHVSTSQPARVRAKLHDNDPEL